MDNRNHLTTARECHPNMGWHIVRAFVGVDEVRSILGNKMIKKSLQIRPGTWISIFHNHQTRTGVLNKDRKRASLNTGSRHSFNHLIRDFIRPLALGVKAEFF